MTATEIDPGTETLSRPAEWARLAGLAALGVLAGIAAKAADESGLPWAAALGSFPAVWVLTVALLGRFAPTWIAAALRSATFFAAMSVAYYAWAAEILDFGWNDRVLTAWLVLSATAVPGTAVAVWWASRRAGVLSGALLGGAAAIVLAGGVVEWQYWIWTGVQPWLVSRPVQFVVDVGTALVLLLVLPRHPRTRLWAVVLTVPITWLLWQSGLLDQVP
jgi:hypothetical protein